MAIRNVLLGGFDYAREGHVEGGIKRATREIITPLRFVLETVKFSRAGTLLFSSAPARLWDDGRLVAQYCPSTNVRFRATSIVQICKPQLHAIVISLLESWLCSSRRAVCFCYWVLSHCVSASLFDKFTPTVGNDEFCLGMCALSCYVKLRRGPGQLALGLASPIFLSSLILYVSGIPMLEEQHDKKYGNDPRSDSTI